MDFDKAPLLEGRTENQVNKALDGYIGLRNQRRGEIDFIRTAIEMALSEENPLERDKIMIELLGFVKTL